MSQSTKLYFPFGPVKGVTQITLHAYQRFLERCAKVGVKMVSTHLQRMEIMLSGSTEVFLKPEKVLTKLLNHTACDARYFLKGTLHEGTLFVVSKGVLITVHAANTNEFTVQAQGKGAAQ